MSIDLLSPTHASHSPEALSAIRDQGCQLSLWLREPINGVEQLVAGEARDVRVTLDAQGFASGMAKALDQAGFAQGPARQAFEADVAMLAQQYQSAMGLSLVELRIEIVTTDSCRKWHADYVSARLITTYCGSATQWLEPADAERVKRGEEPLAVQSMKAGDVGMFKGKLWTDRPVIHRSPPIAGTGERRLLVVLNPPQES